MARPPAREITGIRIMSIQVSNIQAVRQLHRARRHQPRLPTGELVALLGPSGCGKTTLLRIIAGLEQADSGQVFCSTATTLPARMRERQVGFVFQHYALFRHMTVFDNVAFGMRMKPRRAPIEAKVREKVHELLNWCSSTGWPTAFPSQLSGGQRQRIALARALAVEPRAAARRTLRRARCQGAQGTAPLVAQAARRTAHHLDLRHPRPGRGARSRRPRGADGPRQVEQVGTPEEVYRHPATPFVYGFLGSVNLFHGRVEGETVRVGDDALPHEANELDHGAEVVAFARPHELEIVTDPQSTAGIAARVSRVLSFGVTARVELDGVNGLDRPAFRGRDHPRAGAGTASGR